MADVLTEASFVWLSSPKTKETLADTLATFVTLAAIQLGVRRLARE
jgi:hypothetical protein